MKIEKKQGPRHVSGLEEMGKKNKEKSRARDASRALVVVILVPKKEVGGLETRFDVSRAPRARRRR
jgi:hypothetical protein